MVQVQGACTSTPGDTASPDCCMDPPHHPCRLCFATRKQIYRLKDLELALLRAFSGQGRSGAVTLLRLRCWLLRACRGSGAPCARPAHADCAHGDCRPYPHLLVCRRRAALRPEGRPRALCFQAGGCRLVGTRATSAAGWAWNRLALALPDWKLHLSILLVPTGVPHGAHQRNAGGAGWPADAASAGELNTLSSAHPHWPETVSQGACAGMPLAGMACGTACPACPACRPPPTLLFLSPPPSPPGL